MASFVDRTILFYISTQQSLFPRDGKVDKQRAVREIYQANYPHNPLKADHPDKLATDNRPWKNKRNLLFHIHENRFLYFLQFIRDGWKFLIILQYLSSEIFRSTEKLWYEFFIEQTVSELQALKWNLPKE